MERAIVAIGGGEIRTRGTAAIDREIIRLSNKEHPKILFIPTASSDSERYCRRFAEHFGKFLKCKTDVLSLIDAPPSAHEIERTKLEVHQRKRAGARQWRTSPPTTTP
jgi:dipeptidase E